ncbi:MAG TPA: cytochrome c biogenesis protein CcsA [Gaiellaceae bacterium]|nr:cytochrome c biogenesis protein CcsA [Gaiellaceae bacterium]
MVEALFWPALLGYGEAAVAYASARTARAATWGVRLGWLAQTALLAAQAVRADGFPWSTWAASLNLFVWLVVGTYLIWGCRPRFRLLGLAVMPLAAALFVVARLGGGTRGGSVGGYGSLFLVLHVGLVLAAFAGFTLAAALAALYLWQERRLKSRAPDILRLRLPPLQSLERLTWRTVAVSLPLLTLGLAAGVVRMREQRAGFDALEAVTLLTWLVYGGFLVLRPSGRRASYLALGGFALVIVTRLALAGSHFA